MAIPALELLPILLAAGELAPVVVPPTVLLLPLIAIPGEFPARFPFTSMPTTLPSTRSPLDWRLIPAPPKIETGTAIVGSGDAAAIAITKGAVPDAIAKVIWSVCPAAGGWLFALRIACRSEPTNEPWTLSEVFVTVKGLLVGLAVVVA